MAAISWAVHSASASEQDVACPLSANSRHCRFHDIRNGTNLFLPVPIGCMLHGGIGMKLPRRTFLHLAASAAALPAVSRIAGAQAYPSRPVRIVVGFAAGG